MVNPDFDVEFSEPCLDSQSTQQSPVVRSRPVSADRGLDFQCSPILEMQTPQFEPAHGLLDDLRAGDPLTGLSGQKSSDQSLGLDYSTQDAAYLLPSGLPRLSTPVLTGLVITHRSPPQQV